MALLQALRSLDVHARWVPTDPLAPDRGLDGVLDVDSGDVSARFAVEIKTRSPYPSEFDRLVPLRDAAARAGTPLLVVPFVHEALGLALTTAGWSWADSHGNFDLRAPSLVLRQRTTATAPKPRRGRLPQGSGSLAIIRSLIRFGASEAEEAGATTLAAQARVSQPRASQVLHQLHDLELVERVDGGRWRPRRAALLDRFLAEYRGPGGSERYLYSLEAPAEVALRAVDPASGRRVVVSADVGPDLLVAWRRPSVVILYVEHDLDPSDLDLVEAQGRHDANVVVRSPRDASVFPSMPQLVSQFRQAQVPLADPSQLIWDLHDLGGADRLEAAGMLREWLLANP